MQKATPKSTVSPFLIICFLFYRLLSSTDATGGSWQLLQRSAGVSAMHMQLLNNDRVVIFDRTNFGKSNISLPDGKCRTNDEIVKPDCTAHSVEYNVVDNVVRPLMVLTDTWCSSGTVMADGSLFQTGGNGDGGSNVRIFNPCSTCDWKEIENGLIGNRWYASNHILPDNREIVIGGRSQFNYEFYPKVSGGDKLYSLPFLAETNDYGIENNLYPFVFLYPDGNIFIFANNRAILLDYANDKVVKTYPPIPGGDPRNYPSSGSAVLLPLKNLTAPSIDVEVLVCGGAPKGSFQLALKGLFVKALNTCARMKISDPNPEWGMETMPLARVMGDMILLPSGNVLLINGAGAGAVSFELGREPVLSPVLYKPENPSSSRFEVQNPSTIPRMYHSTAILLRDGRILVGGSNPNPFYNFTGVLFPTELSLEAFSPPYLDAKFVDLRPEIIMPRNHTKFKYGQRFTIWFKISGALNPNEVKVTMVAPSFTTHSFSMNQRQLVLDSERVTNVGILGKQFWIEVAMPGSPNLAPSGYYLFYVVHQDIPSDGIWIHVY